MKQPYWVKVFGKVPPYVLFVTPWESGRGGAVSPASEYYSWERVEAHLAPILESVELEKAKRDLLREGGWVADGQVFLSDEQARELGGSLS